MTEEAMADKALHCPDEATIRGRLEALRAAMCDAGCEGIVLPTGDPHISEYPPAHWSARAWASGFTGSAGTLAVLRDEAALWTDGRYTIQAARQMEGTGIALHRAAEPGCPKLEEWLCDHLDASAHVCCDGRQLAAGVADRLRTALNKNDIHLRLDIDPVEGLWADRPSLPHAPAFVHDLRFAGQSVAQKLESVRAAMTRHGVTHYLVSSLDAVGWLLNIRGADIPCTPLVLAYVLVGQDEVCVFIDAEKCPPQVKAHLADAGITACPYGAARGAIGALDANAVLLIDPKATCEWLREAVPETCRVVAKSDPVQALKAVKNAVELDRLRVCVERDCASVARFLSWLDASIEAGAAVTERSAAAYLESMRCENEHYLGPSFETIAAAGEHGALMHYAVTPDTDANLAGRGFFLIDSGGQYLDGTTDITRTVACGALSEQQRRDYTLVLKGHIALSRAVFLHGTCGPHLDILARGPLAREGLDYRCGTGHGVGFCLGVHEGPHGIRNGANDVILEPGMVVTNEPGVYREGEYGVRIENTLIVCEREQTACGRFLAFEMLSYCPIDTRPVMAELLTGEEAGWLDAYQAEACRRLAPHVDPETRDWLDRVTARRFSSGEDA